MRLTEGQRVIVKTANSITINAVGTVKRMRTDGAAWIALDKRSVEGAHHFPADDSRGNHVMAEPEDCEPVTERADGGNRAQRRQNRKIAKQPKTAIESFGKDHWSTFGYLAYCATDGIGRHDNRKMRCDPKRHPFLAHEGSMFGSTSPTRLKGDALLHDHDDWDCADDLAQVGLLENVGTSANPLIKLTSLGFDVWRQLAEHKQNGGNFARFSPTLKSAQMDQGRGEETNDGN